MNIMHPSACLNNLRLNPVPFVSSGLILQCRISLGPGVFISLGGAQLYSASQDDT